jgi:hypothetical protein
MQFDVANFEMAYNVFLGRSGLTKFKAIPHYTYLVLKMSGPNGVITIKGDVKQANDCDRESCDMADALIAYIELQNLKKTLGKPPSPPPTLTPQCQKLRQPSCPSRQRRS